MPRDANAKTSPRICVVGSANVDLTARAPRFPKPGETLAGESFHLGMGGKGANQAVAAARLGARVTFIARVGSDVFSADALRHYKTEGIDTSFIKVDSDHPTGTALIVVDSNAENCIVVVGGANARLSPDDVRAATEPLSGGDVVLCQLETPIDAALEAFRIASVAGVRTILTPAPAVALPNQLLEACSVCIPNETELEVLVGAPISGHDSAVAGARELRSRGIETVVVTQGSRGALVVDRDGVCQVPAIRVDAVDPTGAGDAFTAAFAVFLAEGQGIREAAHKAAAVAALTVTRMGAQSAFPRRDDLD